MPLQPAVIHENKRSTFMIAETRVKPSGLLYLLTVLSSMLAAPAQAQESSNVHPYLTNKYAVDMGAFLSDRTLKIRVNGTAPGDNSEVDFENSLRSKSHDETFALYLGWRFGEKWSLFGQYFDSSVSTGAALKEDVEWKDIVFAAGSSVVGGQDFRLLRVFFGRSFETSDRHDFGVGAGFHWLEIDAFIEGNVILGGGGVSFRREAVNASGPLPNIGVWYQYSLSPRWALRSRLDWLEASVGDYEGKIINAAFGLNYQTSDHFGIGLDYSLVELDVDVIKSDWRGGAIITYDGPYAYLSFYW